MDSLIDFYLYISRAKLCPILMFSTFTHVMKPVRDTNSEPGLPVFSEGLPVFTVFKDEL